MSAEPEAADGRAPERLPMRALMLLALSVFCAVACTRAADPLLDLIAAEFGVTAGQASIVVTMYGLAYGLLQVFYGPVGDRVGKFRVVCITCALTTVGTMACAFSDSLPMLAAARLLTGATAGALLPMSIAWISDIVPYERRQNVLAKFATSNFLGSALGAVMAGLMAERYGWRSIFYLLSAMFLAVAVALFLELRRNPQVRQAAAPANTGALRQFLAYFRESRARNFLAMVALESALMMSPMVFLPLHGQREFGLSPSQSAVLMIAVLVGGLVFIAASAPLTRRWDKRWLISAGGAMVSIGMLGMVFAPMTLAALPLLLLFGFGSTMLHNTLTARATQFSPQARGVSVTLFGSCQYASAALGVWLEGPLVDLAGTSALFGLCAAGLPAVLFYFMRRMLRSDAPAAP